MKRHVITFLKAVAACVLIGYLFKSGRLRTETVVRLLDPGSTPFLILSAFAFLFSQILVSIRMIFLLKGIDLRMGFIHIFRLTMIGNFFNMVVPGTIGGDLVKGYYLSRNEDTSKGRSSGIIVIDRVLGLIALCVIGLASAIYITRKYGTSFSAYSYEFWAMVTLTFVMVVLFLALIFISKYEPARQKTGRILLTLLPKGFFYNAVEGFALIIRKRSYLCYALLISLVAHGAFLAGLLNLLNLNGEKLPDLVALAGVSSIVMLMGIIPLTPGNIGWTEFLASVGWSAMGAKSGADIFLTWRIITAACSLMGGFFYLTPSRSLDKCEKRPDHETPINRSKPSHF